MNIKKIVYLSLGFIGLVFGTIGAFLPFLPTVPFLLIATFGFGKSSEKLDNWFKNTKIYKNNLETYVKGQGMLVKSKIKIILVVTILMGTGYMMMGNVPVAQTILAIVWILHIIYFSFIVKTIKT